MRRIIGAQAPDLTIGYESAPDRPATHARRAEVQPNVCRSQTTTHGYTWREIAHRPARRIAGGKFIPETIEIDPAQPLHRRVRRRLQMKQPAACIHVRTHRL